MESLDLPDAGFDVVVCVLGLYYAQDPVRALAELWRVLRPGGTLAVTVWGERSLAPAQTQFLDAVAAERPGLGRRITPDRRLGDVVTLTDAFRRAGTTHPTIIQETIVHACTPDTFWRIVLGSGYRISLDAIGPEAAERVRTALRVRMQAEGVHELTSDVLYARALKD